MKRTRKIAVVTTFSLEGWELYAKRMVDTFIRFWPQEVDLFLYSDAKISVPDRPNVHLIYKEIPEKIKFINKYRAVSRLNGYVVQAQYNYRYDAVKFCHKPFALREFAHNYAKDYDGLIWLDGDTITHAPIDMAVVNKIAPTKFDLQFLGRSYKYTECGYLYFDLKGILGTRLLNKWVWYYTSGQFKNQKEWHDSWLFDLARCSGLGLRANDLTGHISRKQGGGHPFINCVLGQYMDHLKGDTRKATKAPRKNDLFVGHDTPYWRNHSHAQHTPRKRRNT